MGELNSVESLWAARQELPKSGNGQKVALWRVISGMEVGKEGELSPGERAAGLKKLVNVFARVLKTEFLEALETAKGAGGDVLATESDEELPRSLAWDPVATVCSYLSIAERMLSRLGKEVCGYSAQQMADRLRVRGLREKLHEELEAFVRKEMAEDHRTDTEHSGWQLDVQWYLYKRWVAHKREKMTESGDARAVRFGFKYFGRYKAACLMEFGKTPEELEFEALGDAAMYFAARDTLERRASGVENPRSSFRKSAQKPYRDVWAKTYRERPEWLMGMMAKFGVSPGLEKHARDVGE